MTALEAWLVQIVEVAVGHTPDETAPPYVAEDRHKSWAALEQRVAILLVQARALECRHLAGELAVGGANHPVAVQIMEALWDRSHKLEAIGLMLAKQWPPVDGNETLVCRCSIDTDEIQQNVPEGMKAEGQLFPFVCAHCKLPKHGKTGNGPVMVTQ